MPIVVLHNNITKKDLKKALGDYKSYIKITTDIHQELVAVGGEYHADAENYC